MAASPLLVVDAPSLLFRAFYALPKTITGPGGQPVNALLGSVNLVLREVEQHRPRAVVMCFGPDAAPYRVELFEGYHSERPPVPDELAPQFADAPAFYEAFGWYVDHDDSVEADDLLHSYARVEEAAGGEALIMTGDRDLYQSVTDRVTVLYVKTGAKGGAEVVTPDEVRRRYGIGPEKVPDFIALRGDPSDGIPGAKGVGEKTAADLLQRCGDLEGAIKGALRESPRLRASLRDGADELRDFKEIATLRLLDVPRPADRPLDTEGAAAAARERGMNRLAERLEKLARY